MPMMPLKKNKLLLIFITVTSFIFSQERVEKLSVRINPNLNIKKIRPQIEKIYLSSCQNIEKKLLLSSPKQINIMVCATSKEMNSLAGYSLPSWAIGVAFSSRNLILINYQNINSLGNSLPSVLEHEVCHLYLGSWEKKHNLELPQWFNEGICEWISGRLHLQYTTKIFEHAVWDQIIPLKQLEKSFPSNAQKASLAYVQSRDIITYIANNYGSKSIANIIKKFAQTKKFPNAIEQITKTSLTKLEKDWIQSITPEYKWFWRITQLFSLFTIMAILTLLAYYKQKKRKQKIMDKWEKEDGFYEDIGY